MLFFIKLNSRSVCIPMRVRSRLKIDLQEYSFVKVSKYSITIDGMLCGSSYAYSYRFMGHIYDRRESIVRHCDGDVETRNSYTLAST